LRKGEIVDREKSFAHAMGRRVIERKANGDPPSGEEDIATGADYFEEMRARDFGHGPAVRYCHARHSKYGWLSNWSNQLLLRIDRKEDRRAFLDDVLDGSPRLHQPDGIGRSMMLEMKTLCLSGTLDEEEWSEPVVSRLLPPFPQDPGAAAWAVWRDRSCAVGSLERSLSRAAARQALAHARGL
ncbi:MAG: hypothetical protein MUF04_08490, partial [Akkermansiaceae bacterium]|nr:hypothetical protein [Akkermansiaceae bacterium]